MLGYNSRLDELQAAILRVKLRHLDEWTERRRYLAEKYNEQFNGTGIGTPFVSEEVSHAYHLYIIDVDNRQRVQEQLKERGIPTAVYYPQPLHLSQPLAATAIRALTSQSPRRASERTLSIPFYPEMQEEQLRSVAEKVKSVVKATASK
jgi:dTDP-4-amino-4,6-dideoxygalactose transaminase